MYSSCSCAFVFSCGCTTDASFLLWLIFFSLPLFSLLLWVFLSYSSRTRSLLLPSIQWIQKSVWLDTFDFGFLWFTSASIALYFPIFSTFSTMECDCRELDFSCIRFLFDFSPFDFIPELHLLCAIPWNSLSGWTHNPSKCIERRRRKITSLVHHNCCRVHDWQGKNGSDSRNNFAKKKKSQWTQNCKILCVQSERGGGVWVGVWGVSFYFVRCDNWKKEVISYTWMTLRWVVCIAFVIHYIEIWESLCGK